MSLLARCLTLLAVTAAVGAALVYAALRWPDQEWWFVGGAVVAIVLLSRATEHLVRRPLAAEMAHQWMTAAHRNDPTDDDALLAAAVMPKAILDTPLRDQPWVGRWLKSGGSMFNDHPAIDRLRERVQRLADNNRRLDRPDDL